jgi:iron complex outermembrane recepter protein
MTAQTTNIPPLRRWLGQWLGVATLALLGLLSPSAFAQTTGTITGQVLDSTSGKYLEGAEVSVEAQGASFRTTTERGGRFTLANVPTGSQTLVVTYPGLETKTETVVVTSSGAVDVPVNLTAEMVLLEAMTVSTAKEGMAQAQALQKASVQFKLVAANDQFGPVSEGNIGEYLKFLPGVSIDYNVNDARGVSLRGLSTAFTIVAVDGTPMAGASSTDDTRRFEFEQIAMNNVETTELFKTVTPDIPASATGGYVNFVTKSAFDRQDANVFTYDLSLSTPHTNMGFGRDGGVWGNGKEYVVRPSIELNWARHINSKVGVNINYRLSEKYDDSPRTEYTWVTATTAPTVFQTPRLQQYNVRNEQKLTHRQALAGKIDYRISDQTKLTLSGQWNWYDLLFTQRGPQFILGTASTRTGDTFTSGATGASIQNGTLFRNKYGSTYHVNSTLAHEFANGSKASLTGYWSFADGQYRDTSKGFISATSSMAPGATTFTNFSLGNVFELGRLADISLTRTGTPVSVDFIRSLANYTYSNTATGTSFQSRPWTAEDTKKGVNGDYTYDFAGLPFPLKLQTGFAYDLTDRDINRPDLRGAIPATTGAALQALRDPNWGRDVAQGFGLIEVLDPYKVWEAFRSNLTVVQADDFRSFAEENLAGFVRLDAKLTDEILLVGGVRWEKREIESSAQSRVNTRSKFAVVDLDYDEWYPSLSLKYTPKFNRQIVARAGASRTVGHPDYSELLPSITSESTPAARDGTISVPAPDLQPFFSNNFDVALDYYLGRTGVLGLSLFRKNVENYIIARPMTAGEITSISTDYGYNPNEFSSGTVRANGGSSHLQGVEFSYAQRLSFLPAPFSGFNVQANYTLTDVSSSDVDTEYAQLRAVSPKTANFVLGYRHRAFSATATVNWVDESLYGGFVNTSYFTGTAGTATTPDTRLTLNKDELTTVNLKLEYAFDRRISVYFLVRNLTNSPRKEFLKGYLPENRGVTLPLRYFEFGEPHYTIGIRGTF